MSAIYLIDGKPHRICDCPEFASTCPRGVPRPLQTCGFGRCLVPATDVLLSALPEVVTLHPNVDGQDFYELCQQYRHSKEIMPLPSIPNTVQAFDNLRRYIKTGALPWASYEREAMNNSPK